MPAEPAASPPPAGRAAPPRRRLGELGAYLSYLALAVLVLIQLWISPSGRVLASNDDDHGFFLFVLAHGERVLFHGANPFCSDRLNSPDGVNMMANTSILALSLPMAPVTHFFGAGVCRWCCCSPWAWPAPPRPGTGCCPGTWCAAGSPPGSAACGAGSARRWCRTPTGTSTSSPSSWCRSSSGRCCGCASRAGRCAAGSSSGLLIVLQVFINEEVLLFTALTLGVFVLAYAAMAWPAAASRGAAVRWPGSGSPR